jgi:hypothetical protein
MHPVTKYHLKTVATQFYFLSLSRTKLTLDFPLSTSFFQLVARLGRICILSVNSINILEHVFRDILFLIVGLNVFV